jgi:hypothetical protein
LWGIHRRQRRSTSGRAEKLCNRSARKRSLQLCTDFFCSPCEKEN